MISQPPYWRIAVTDLGNGMLLKECLMHKHDQDRLISRVINRLAQKFPLEAEETIAGAVARENHSHDGDPVHAYMPIIVERAVSATLREKTDSPRPQTLSATTGAPQRNH